MTTLANINKKRGDVCPHQFAFMLDNVFRKLIQSPKKVVGEYLKEGDTALDVGCGPGYFSIDMAKMVGSRGKVIAADLQDQMLQKVKKKAAKHGVLDRMEFHQCLSDRVGLDKKVDFILAFYMVHETPDPLAFLTEMKQTLNPAGKLLIVEPKMHVSQESFNQLHQQVKEIGFSIKDQPNGKGGRALLLTV